MRTHDLTVSAFLEHHAHLTTAGHGTPHADGDHTYLLLPPTGTPREDLGGTTDDASFGEQATTIQNYV